MSTVPAQPRIRNDYPTWSPEVPESHLHRIRMNELIEALEEFYAGQQVYVAGNMLIFYEQGNRRRHVSPDVFVVRGVSPEMRDNYLVWEEPRGPEFVIELTSASTRNVDQRTKRNLYRDVLRVQEYFLFDPRGEFLDPPLIGYRLQGTAYRRIRPLAGRLPSEVTGLHLEVHGDELRLWHPATEVWLPTQRERLLGQQEQIEAQQDRLEGQQDQLAEKQQRLDDAEAELDRLRRELERLRGGP